MKGVARCQGRPDLQKQALSPICHCFETQQPEPIERGSHCSQPRPPLPPRAPRHRYHHVPTHPVFCYHPVNRGSTACGRYSGSSMPDRLRPIRSSSGDSEADCGHGRRGLHAALPCLQAPRLPHAERRGHLEARLLGFRIRPCSHALQLRLLR